MIPDAFWTINTSKRHLKLMRLTATEREKRLTEAVNFYQGNNRSISIWKVAAKFTADCTTLNNQINTKHSSIQSNGSLNNLLAVVQLGALFSYLRKQG